MNLKIVGAAVAALAVSACAGTAEDTGPVSPPPVVSAATPGSVAEFQATAGDTVFFEFDSFALTSAARQTLGNQAEWLQSYPAVTVRLEGNCDERGTREYNLALGERRANSARDYLVSLGVDPSRITIVSYGKERPRDPASNESAWAVNRNSTTAIISGAAS